VKRAAARLDELAERGATRPMKTTAGRNAARLEVE
jgi:hypothetical protein